MSKYIIQKGFEIIGETRTIEEAKAMAEEYCKNSAEKCNLTYSLKRELTDDDVTVLIFQYNTLYLDTFIISKGYRIEKK